MSGASLNLIDRVLTFKAHSFIQAFLKATGFTAMPRLHIHDTASSKVAFVLVFTQVALEEDLQLY